MSEINVLEELDLDKWIYAGYLTTYRESYTLPEGEEEELGPGELPEICKYYPEKKDIHREQAGKPCSSWCICTGRPAIRKAPVPVDERLGQVDNDYLKGAKSVYQQSYCSGPSEIEPPFCTVVPKTDVVEIEKVKLSEEEKQNLVQDFQYRQKIKILRKKPPALDF